MGVERGLEHLQLLFGLRIFRTNLNAWRIFNIQMPPRDEASINETNLSLDLTWNTKILATKTKRKTN